MALAHKGLEVETIPWHFTEKSAIAFAGSERVPVIVDGTCAVKDSWPSPTTSKILIPAGRPCLAARLGEHCHGSTTRGPMACCIPELLV